jgi:ribosomal-protein-alanine N-acetyltransferase
MTHTMAPVSGRLIDDADEFDTGAVRLRLVRLSDCTPEYVAWLADPVVNQYLETRWSSHDLSAVRDFVSAMRARADSYLFAIIDRSTNAHVGNIKVGPINAHHGYADVSYFIGVRSAWGRGLATDAIRGASRLAFERLGLARVQAGVYENNIGSIRALEKAGYRLEGRFRRQLQSAAGRQDHLWYGLLPDELPAE